MAKISIICPNCRAKLSFAEIAGWQDKLVECPHCHFKAKASVYQSGQAAQGGQGADDDPTQLPGNYHPAFNNAVGVIKVVKTDRSFPLKEGTNIIGRIAKSGKADLQISDDPYMSRQHLRIDVVKQPWGIEHHLVYLEAKNTIVLNGKPIHSGDILKLNFGDHMILGQTEIILECPDEEATLTV